MKFVNLKFPFVLALALILVGCATTQIKGRVDLLEFLVDGKTTKEESMIKLGQPVNLKKKKFSLIGSDLIHKIMATTSLGANRELARILLGRLGRTQNIV